MSIIFCLIFLLLSNNVLAFKQDYIPSDPNIIYQNYFNLINIESSWSNDLQINKEIIVAVLDSGMDLDHPDLKNNLWINMDEIPDDGIDNDGNSYIDDINGWDFVDSDNIPEPEINNEYNFTAINHGTVIAGIIAAESNSSGIVGISPESKIMTLRILDEEGSGNTLTLSQAINYAVENNADIINLSLVGSFYNPDLKEAIINAYNKGVIIVAASGNEDSVGLNLDEESRYPVCDIDDINRVLGVAAIDNQKKLASFSNYGEECIDISAPGTDFYSTVYHNSNNSSFYKYYSSGWSGTSVAAPIVSATAALIKMNYPSLRPSNIYEILLSSASELKTSNPQNYKNLGSGLINVGAALNLAKEYINQEINIVISPEANLKPEIFILDKLGNLKYSFMAYNENFYGGVNIAVGDINGDGINEIITAPMKGGGPHIRVFDKNGNVLYQFMAYNENFYGGVNIAVGDVKNDERAEIITAPASGHIPEIKVFKGVILKHKFLSYDISMTNGVKLAVGDVNNDNWKEILTVPNNMSPIIKLFNFKGRKKGEFLSYSEHLKTGINIIAKDFSGDKKPEILTLPNKGSAALLKIYDSIGLEKDTFYLRNINDKNGYHLDILVN